jgi:hypothetical protein
MEQATRAWRTKRPRRASRAGHPTFLRGVGQDFFFEKKKQKTFARLGAHRTDAGAASRSPQSYFSAKNRRTANPYVTGSCNPAK